MITSKLMFYTLYAHNLKEPHKSFNTDLSLKDFTLDLQAYEAECVVYVNPRCEELVIFKGKNVVRIGP